MSKKTSDLTIVEEKPVAKAKADKTTKKKKPKKPNKMVRAIKETGSELKKVNYPTFGKVVKQTGVVIAVVAIFAVVLLLIDLGLAQLYDLLVGILK